MPRCEQQKERLEISRRAGGQRREVTNWSGESNTCCRRENTSTDCEQTLRFGVYTGSILFESWKKVCANTAKQSGQKGGSDEKRSSLEQNPQVRELG